MSHHQPERPFFEYLFLTPDNSRPRAGWRIAGQWLVFSILLALLAGPLFAIGALGEAVTPENIFVGKLAESIALVGSLVIARKLLDRRPFLDLGLHWQARSRRDLLAGVAIGGGMAGLIFVLLLVAGGLTITGFAAPAGLLRLAPLMLANFALIAFSEELLARGYFLQNIEAGLSLTAALLLSSAYYPLLHLLSGGDLATGLGIYLLNAFFAFAYVQSRQLWLPMGLHLGFYFAVNTVLGLPVSGLPAGGWLQLALADATVTPGLATLTGGAAGIEASLLLLPALLAGGWLVSRYAVEG